MTEPVIILITGASRGIGAALARRLAAPGVALMLATGHARDQLRSVAAECRQAGAEVANEVRDLAEPETAAELVALCQHRFGGLDQLVHVAGFAERRPFGELSTARLQYSLTVIEQAFAELVTAALPLLAQSSRARVVAVSSFLAHCHQLVGGSYPASAAAKAGLEAMVKSLAAQLAGSGCTVNCVVPGYIQKDAGSESSLTAQQWQEVIQKIPLHRLGLPDEVAGAIEFLLSDTAAYITGQALHVNGGLTL